MKLKTCAGDSSCYFQSALFVESTDQLGYERSLIPSYKSARTTRHSARPPPTKAKTPRGKLGARRLGPCKSEEENR